MPRINVEIKDGIHKKFLIQCEKDGRSASDVIRELILSYTERRLRERHSLAMIEICDEDEISVEESEQEYE